MNRQQKTAVARAVRVAEHAAVQADVAFKALHEAFPVANGRDCGAVMAAAKHADHTKADAQALRHAADACNER